MTLSPDVVAVHVGDEHPGQLHNRGTQNVELIANPTLAIQAGNVIVISGTVAGCFGQNASS